MTTRGGAVNVSLSGAASYRGGVTSPSACPSCGAAVRPDSPWCTLCYADLQPPAAEPEPVPEAVPEPVATTPAPPPVPPVPAAAPSATPTANPTWPCTSCGTPNSFDRDTCSKCGTGFLAAAHDSGPLLELPVVGDIARLSRAQRLALVSGVVLVFIALTLIIGVVV